MPKDDELEVLRTLVGDAYNVIVGAYEIKDADIVPPEGGSPISVRVRLIDDKAAVAWLERVTPEE